MHNDRNNDQRRTKQSEEREFHKGMAKFVNDHHCRVELLKN